MNKDRMHLIPPIVGDIAASAVDKTKQDFQRDAYIARLEAIRDYCIEVLEKAKR